MKRTTALALLTVLSGCVGAPDTMQQAEPASPAALIQILGVEPPVVLDPDCPPIPLEARSFNFAIILRTSEVTRPAMPGFPADFCPPGAAFYAEPEGHGTADGLGDFEFSERLCAVPPGRLVAQGHFEFANGDRLEFAEVTQADSVPLPIPFATFTGEFTFVGGSGSFSETSGVANVVATQMGDAPPGQPAGSTTAAGCGWLVN